MIFVGRLRNSIGLIPRRINSAYGCLMDKARMPHLSEILRQRVNERRYKLRQFPQGDGAAGATTFKDSRPL